jgi:hypothetical protein
MLAIKTKGRLTEGAGTPEFIAFSCVRGHTGYHEPNEEVVLNHDDEGATARTVQVWPLRILWVSPVIGEVALRQYRRRCGQAS